MRGIGAATATRGTGSSRGFVGATPTGVEIGLKVGGIGQLGISTDYGGGIVVGIFGQKIVWGREGGKIHYNVGGLEVIVEARDCVVVETRKIAGYIVGRHVYPDPGCKLPPEEPEEPQAEPDPPPGSDGTEKLNFPEFAWVALDCTSDWTAYNGAAGPNRVYTAGTQRTISRVKAGSPGLTPALSLDVFSHFENTAKITFERTTLNSSSDLNGSAITTYTAFVSSTRPFSQGLNFWDFNATTITVVKTPSNYPYNVSGPGLEPFVVYGTGVDIAAYIKRRNASPEHNVNIAHLINGQITTHRYSVGVVVKQKQPLLSPIFPPAGNQPPMPESCCEALAADIEDIKEVLACKEILAGKMTFPWSWRMPGGQGEEVIMDYPNLLRAIAQQIDHLGIHPPKLTVKDINNAIAGDQGLTNQFPSVTQAFEALMAQVWDANADVDTLTNFLYRLAWLNVQQSFNMARLTGSVEALKDMIGGDTESLEAEITTPFNIAAGTGAKKVPPGKGFGKSANQAIDNRIEANTEMSTEAMLPEFLKIRENPILVDSFTGKQDLFDILLLIRADLEKLKNK